LTTLAIIWPFQVERIRELVFLEVFLGRVEEEGLVANSLSRLEAHGFVELVTSLFLVGSGEEDSNFVLLDGDGSG